MISNLKSLVLLIVLKTANLWAYSDGNVAVEILKYFFEFLSIQWFSMSNIVDKMFEKDLFSFSYQKKNNQIISVRIFF